MNSTDSIEDQLRKMLASQASAVAQSRIDAIASRDYAPRTRRRTLPLVGAGGLVAAAAAAVVVGLLSAQPSQHTPRRNAVDRSGVLSTGSPTVTSNSIELVGYRLSFPAGYKIGEADTNCSRELHLSADEARRLVTTPEPGCPLLVTSVVKSLPHGATKFQFQSQPAGTGGTANHPDHTLKLTFYAVTDGDTHTTYVPAALPGGSIVYVVLAGPPIGVYWPSTNVGPAYSLTQLSQFERGLAVTQ